MSREEMWDIVNMWEEMPVMISTISEYDVEKGKVRHSPFRVKALPDSYIHDASQHPGRRFFVNELSNAFATLYISCTFCISRHLFIACTLLFRAKMTLVDACVAQVCSHKHA